MAWNDQSTTSLASWNPDAVEPQLGYPAIWQEIKLKASTTFAKGTLLGELTASPGTFAAYADGNSDGTQTARCVLPRQVTTDSSGLIYDGAQASSEEIGYSRLTTPAIFSGVLKIEDVAGLDANGLADLGGKVIAGSISGGAGLFKF